MNTSSPSASSKCIHFIGIGGVGMSALAQVALDKGWTVTGSDRLADNATLTPTLQTLVAQGVKLSPQDGSGVTAETTDVVYSTAIEEDNPDRLAAKRYGCTLLHRSDALAQLCAGYELIAVTGTCGKSSVTAMLGHLLTVCGKDPLIINGAEMTGYDHAGARIGSVRSAEQTSGLAVVEADESDRSLMGLSPTHVIVTNASSDHFPKEEAVALFGAFKAKASGIVIDTSEAAPEPMPQMSGWDTTFVWRGRAWQLPMPGAHNVANAKVALEMAAALGCEEGQLAEALKTFKGIRRRLERVGVCNGALVIDDYAHNVEKLHAAWTTLQAVAPEGVYGVWRPHGYAPLRKMKENLAQMFNATLRPCDKLLLLPVYDAGGTADRSVNSEDLLALLTCPAESVADLEAAEAKLREAAAPQRVLALFGARDPGLPALAHRLG